MYKGYEYRIYPNKTQQRLLAKTFGCCRYVYNHFLARRIEYHEKQEKYVNSFTLSKELTVLKKSLLWLNNVDSQALQQELRHQDNAFERFFKAKKGFPKFKCKHSHRYSYTTILNVSLDVENHEIKLPKIGKVDIRLDRIPKGQIKSVTVKQVPSGKYFVSLTVLEEDNYLPKEEIKTETTIGIDLGLKHFAILSNGTKIDNPKYLKNNFKKLQVLQKRLSRKQKGSANREKARIKVARQHEKIYNMRKDFLHKLTYKLTHENQVSTICIEDLAVSNMMRNHKLARSISDVSWYKFRTLLEYKCEIYGKNLLVIGTFEPSSKMCTCGYINKHLTLSDRYWTCPNCGLQHDRDVLAANNIKKFALSKTGLVKTGEPTELLLDKKNEEVGSTLCTLHTAKQYKRSQKPSILF